MNEIVHILVLEAKATDYDLIRGEIRKSLKDCTTEQAKTRKDFVQALKATKPNIILANYDLPRFNGLKALELAREHAPMTPVIIWTNEPNEEIVVDCMKAGANNYISKKNIKRLAPAIIHALEDRELLKGSPPENPDINMDERFEALIKNGRDNISLLDKNGNLVWESPSAAPTLGYSMNEFKGRNIFELIHPDDQYWTRELFAKLTQEPGRSRDGVFRLKHSNGTWRWIEATATNMLDNENVRALVINYRDITDRREVDTRIRESEERFSKAFNLGPAALSIAHIDGGVFLAVNEAYLNLFGYEYAEVVGHTPLELNMFPDEEEAPLAMKLLHEQTDFRDQEFKIRTKSGEVRTVISSGEPIELGGEKYMLSFLTDVTERKKAEEEQSRQSRNLSILYTLGKEISASLDLMSIYASTHRAAFRLMPSDVFLISILDETDQEIEDVYLWDTDRLWKTQRYPIGQDLPGYIISSNKTLRVNHWDETYDKLTGAAVFGYEEKDILSVLAVPLLHSGGKPFGMLSIQSYLPDAYTPAHENLLVLLANQVSRAIENAQLYEKAHKELADRKHAEAALVESESRLRTIVDSEPECVKILDRNGMLVEMNQAGLAMIEADSLDQVKGKDVVNIVAPDHRLAFKSLTNRVLAGESGILAFEIIGLKGTHRWLETHAVPLRNQEGATTGLLGVTRDITERKLANNILRRREAIMSAVAFSAQQLIRTSNWEEIISDVLAKLGRATEVNRVYIFQTHKSTDGTLLTSQKYEWASMDVERQIENPDLQNIPMLEAGFSRWVNMLENDEVVYGSVQDFPDIEQELLTPQNILSLAVVPIFVEEKWWGFIGFDDCNSIRTWEKSEINALKTAAGSLGAAIQRQNIEDTLRESEDQYRDLIENSQDLICTHDLEGNILSANSFAAALLGYPVEDLINMNIKDFLAPVSLERFGAYIASLRRYGTAKNLMTVRTRTGEERIWEYNNSLRTTGVERPIVRGIAHDITDRKRIEDALRDSEERFRSLFDRMLDGVYRSTHAGKFVDVNPAMVKMFGYSSREEMLEVDIKNELYFAPEERGSHLLDTGQEETDIYRMRRKDGSEIWVEDHGSYIHDDKGNIIYHEGILRDITERKQAENETAHHLLEMQALYENGLAVGRLLKPSEIGQQVIATFARHLSWHHVAIRLKQDDSDELMLVALNNPDLSEKDKAEMERHYRSMVSNVGQGLSGWVVQTGKPLRTGNVHSHPQYIDSHAGIQSGLYMPLRIGERVIGVISVESEIADAFTAQDERLLATLSNQAAIAFENSRLYQATQQELAERKRAEIALKTSESHYRDLADSITDIMFELDQNLRFTHWNKSAELITGVPAVEALGKSFGEIFGDTKEQTDMEHIYLNVLSNRIHKSFEVFLNLSREERIYEINAYPSTTGVSVVAKDVTERKLSEIIMQKRFELMNFSTHNTLEDLMQKMLDEITNLVDSEIGFFHFMEEDESTPGTQMWSTRTLELFNVAASEGHHRSVDQAGVWAEAVRQRRPLIQNDIASLPNRKGAPEGHVKLIREIVIPVIRNEKVVAVLGIGNKPQEYTQQDFDATVRLADHAWDIVERKQMELALADERNLLARRVEERTSDLSRANSNLARALRVKDEFLANMSHELRTPLNAVLGLSESLAEQTAGPLNEKQLRYITTIGESGHHLLSLINDILDLAKIDAGQITLNINKVDINSVSEASLRMIKQLALKKNLDVTLDIDEGVELIWADERRLKQMLVNLLSNAVKFTRDYGKLGLEVRGDQNANQVSFTVWDTGMGIKDNDMSLLFQPFVQLDGGLARESAGTGLGLALVAQMARLHGGGVAVESQPGQGSRFTITLPWEPAMKPDMVQRLRDTGQLRPLETNDENRHTILLIEDTEEVTMMVQDYLENAGYQVITALDGLEGIEQARLAHPDLILMDVQMPRVDGLEATKRLRDDPEFKQTPIIALTALAMPNDRELCLAAGMDEYISKPVNLKALVKIIQNRLPDKKEPAKSQ